VSYNVINPYQTFKDSTGEVRAAGIVTFYDNLTTDLASIWSDEALTVPQENPYTLDASGRITGDVKYTGLLTLKIQNADLSDIRTDDNVASLDNQSYLSASNNLSDVADSFIAVGNLQAGYVVADKAEAIALTITAADAGRKIFAVSDDGGPFEIRYNATPGTYADDAAASFFGTQSIPSGGDGTIGIVRLFQGAVNAKWFGAKADAGVTDSTIAFQNWSKYLNTNKGSGYIPGVDTYYKITEGFVILSGIDIYGDGESSWVRNTANDEIDFWNNTCLFFGTYFGGLDEFYDETSYNVDDITAGARTITLSTGGAGSNFSTGSIGLISDPHLTTGATTPYNIHEHMNEVVSVAGDVLTLKYPIKDGYTADGGSPVLIYKETNTNASTIIPSTYTGYNTELAKNSSVKNIKFTQDVSTFGQTVHVACYESLIEGLVVEGASGWGINPCSYTTFNKLKTSFRQTGFEMAYCHNDVLIDGFEITRIGSSATSLGTIVFSETGQDVRLTNFNAFGYTGGDANVGIISAGTWRTHISHGTIDGSDGNGITFIQDEKSNGSSAEYTDIMNQDTQGVYVRSNDVSVSHVNVKNTPAAQEAISVESGVTRYRIENNICGEQGSRTTGDIIYIPDGYTAGGIVKGNETFNTLNREEDNTTVAHTGTLVLTTIKTHTVTQNTTPRDSFSILVRASGYIPAGSTLATKVMDITVGGTNVGKLSLANVDVGIWEFETRIVKETNTSAVVFTKAFADSEANSDNQSTALAFNWTTTDIDIDIDVTLGNVNDTVNLSSWVIEYEGAEYNTVT
jgi:hypothetical protein